MIKAHLDFINMTYGDLDKAPSLRALVELQLKIEGYRLIPKGTVLGRIQGFDDDLEVLSMGTEWHTKRESIAAKWAFFSNMSPLGSNFYICRCTTAAYDLIFGGIFGGNAATVVATSTTGSPPKDANKALEREMKFFFNCQPTDYSKLPPPPAPVNRWPDEDDSW